MKQTKRKTTGFTVASYALLLCLLGSIAVPTALAKRRSAEPPANIGGVYEDFTVGKESGDLEGMRVAIFAAGGAYRAIVQIAQGGAEDPKPVFVTVEVKGMKISFTVEGQKYTGTVSAAGLTLKDVGLLKRKPCASFFSVGP